MRVLVVSHLYPAEADPLRGSFVAEQVRALSKTTDVRVLSGAYELEADVEARREGVPVRYLALPWRAELPSKVALAIAAAAYRRKLVRWFSRHAGEVDIVHAHYGFPDGFAAVSAARRFGLPVVVTLHGDDANLQFRLPVVGRALASAVGRADRIVCVSERMKREVAELMPRLAERLVALPNGYDATDIGYQPKDELEHLLFVGALLPVKNPEVVLRAYARVADEIAVPLVIAGDGPMAHWLRHHAMDLGVADRVQFLGAVPHSRVGGLFRHAKALLLPSAHEGMPIVVIESLATGTPVIASGVGGIGELVTDERFGELVPPGDVDALAAAIRRVCERDYDAETIASHAPVWSWDDNARRLERIYAEAISSRRREAKPPAAASEAQSPPRKAVR